VTAASFVAALAAARRAAGGWVLAGLASLAVVVALGEKPGAAQPQAKAQAAPPEELFRDMRALVRDGKFDLAAVYLRAFVASEPTEPLLLKIEKDYGTTVFQDLRAVPWSDDRKTNDQAKADVETVIAKARAAVAKQLETPDRVNKYIRNLGATEEEREFAELELKRTGDYAVPYMVDALRRSSSPPLTRGILGAIPKQDAATMAGWLAALDGLTPDLQYAVLAAIGRRPDVLDLTKAAQTDFTPRLWYAYGKADTLPGLRDFAKSALERMVRDVERRSAAEELVALARPFANHKATYAAAMNPATGAPATVAVWQWDVKDEKLVKQPPVTTGQADEFFGLRYAKWALDVRPDYEPAQGLVLALAAETAMERGKFGDLARTDPAVYKLLADAPSQVLNDQLDRAFAENRSALVLALVQVLGDRADRAAATGAPNRPSRLERCLSYPNPRVQFAAANALLRSPVPLDGRTRGRVLEVLKREAAGDPGVPSGAKGQAILADPDRKRADETAALLRQIGYDVEVFGTGRDVLRRVARANDFDLLVIDRHVPNPELRDLVAHLRADANAARRPVLVVASSDQAIPPSFDQLMLRFALLIAATESTPVGMPDPYVPDIRRSPEADAAERKTIQDRRDSVFRSTLKTRADRLSRVLDTSGIELSPNQKFQLNLRVEQVTWAVLAAEFPLTRASAPGAYLQYERLMQQIAAQPAVPEYTRRLGLDHLMTLALRFEQDVAGAPPAQARFEAFRARVDAEALGLVVRPPRDYAAEARTARLVGQYPGVRVIPEPYSKTWFEVDVNAAFQDPADRPRDPAEKRASARQAVQWLARMATGEVPGYDARLASAELLGALRTDELADAAIEGVARLPSMDAQVGLVSLAVTPMRPLPLRVRAADAAARHVQTHGKLTPDALTGTVTQQAGTEADADLRGRLMVLRGLLAPSPSGFVAGLRGYNPPLAPPPPPMPMTPAPKPPDEPKN
jgi:CheY-like chemotaxis protein